MDATFCVFLFGVQKSNGIRLYAASNTSLRAPNKYMNREVVISYSLVHCHLGGGGGGSEVSYGTGALESAVTRVFGNINQSRRSLTWRLEPKPDDQRAASPSYDVDLLTHVRCRYSVRVRALWLDTSTTPSSWTNKLLNVECYKQMDISINLHCKLNIKCKHQYGNTSSTQYIQW